jgi:cation/acetate symporter
VAEGWRAYERRIHRILAAFIAGFIAFLLLLAWAEQRGLTRFWIGPIFLFSTVMMYAVIGITNRTTDPEEYYVAGRRIPPMYNGMAAAADCRNTSTCASAAAPRASSRRWRRCCAPSSTSWRRSTASG